MANMYRSLKGSRNINYGFFIDGSVSDPSNAVTYTDDSVGMTPAYMDYANDSFSYGTWESAFFMPRPCMLKSDGTVDYYLATDDFSKKEDGITASDVSNTSYDGNAMMEWGQDGRKIWLCITPSNNGDSAQINIANYKVNNNYHDWNFHNCDSVSAEHFYTPIYNGSVINNKMRSLSGQQVSKSLAGADEITAAKENNATSKELWNIECFADRLLINLLLVLISKSLDSQASFGKGLSNSGNETINDGFRTGVHDSKGLFYGTDSGVASTYANAVKVFGMENYFGFQWRRHNGLILSDGETKVKLTYGMEDGSNISGYNATGEDYITANTTALSGTSGSYISNSKYTNDGIFPQVMSGSQATFMCDACWYNNTGQRFARFGGDSHYGNSNGMFALVIANVLETSGWGSGAALCCKPLT